MRKLLNTLYITLPDSYLTLDGENIVVKDGDVTIGRVPLHNLEGIVSLGYRGVSPALMGACMERDVSITFLAQNTKFLARVTGKVHGNVLLRKKQFAISVMPEKSLDIARNMILAKVFNSRWILERVVRDHGMQIDIESVKNASNNLKKSMQYIHSCKNIDSLRGFEGEAASVYFAQFNQLILQQKDVFLFEKRTRRPPLDNVNALLSFIYTVLTGMMVSALETVGLDPYIGFMHTERPGRVSLALDMIEELRPVLADRFVITLINKRKISEKDFFKKENGAVLLTDEGKKKVLSEWQHRKKEVITHPFLKEKVEWGMVPFVQALFLARFIRGDLDNYPPFFWK